MAGRGCSITVQVTRMDGGEDAQVQEMSLPVALHSPLHVLRDHLSEITGITSPSQVLILCDLTDPDRNRDVLLTGSHDYQSLFECGIRDGSFLTLHPIGISRQLQRNQEEANSQRAIEEEEIDVYSVATTITPAQADHSYNGVVFDIESRGPYETDIISFSFGGMLGRVRIYVRDRAWEPVIDNSYGSWRSIGLATDGWECIADLMCPPSWDRASEIKLERRVTILPHGRRAFYLHSNLPDDLGIQYQSFLEEDIIFEDERIVVYPGLGHTGSEPFDDVNGWYRAYRGLAGGIKYRSKAKHWTIHDHSLFPTELREAVVTTLLCRERSLTHHAALVLNAPQNQAMEQDSSEEPPPPEPTLSITSPTFQSPDTISFRYDFNLLDYESEERQFIEDHATDQPSAAISADQIQGSSNSQEQSPSILIALPLHLVYYLMEFMDWDWYAEVTRRRRDRHNFSDGSTTDPFHQERTRRRRSFSGGSRFQSMSRNRFFETQESQHHVASGGFNPLQTLSGLISSSNRLYNFQDVIQLLLGGGGSIEEFQQMFGVDDDDDDEEADGEGEDNEDFEDSKEDVEDEDDRDNDSMEEEDENEDGYEHKSSAERMCRAEEKEAETEEEGEDQEDDGLTSVIRLRGLGGNSSDGSNI